MPKVVADPEELERFAYNLRQFNEQMKGNMSRLQGQFNQLGSTWRDQEHKKFAEEFQQTMRVLRNFIEVTDVHIPFLLKKAQRIRDYLNLR